MKEYHVCVNGNDDNTGSSELPFRTISKAASIAKAGDTVIVHEGVYREWVKPEYGGESDEKRIVYRAANGEKAVIKGSEPVSDWKSSEGVWTVSVSNDMFAGYNPYEKTIDGDWLVETEGSFQTYRRGLYERKGSA